MQFYKKAVGFYKKQAFLLINNFVAEQGWLYSCDLLKSPAEMVKVIKSHFIADTRNVFV